MKLLNAFTEQVKACGKLKRVWLTSFCIDIEFIETYLLPTVLGMELPRTRMDYEALQLVLNEQEIDFRVFCDRRFIGADQNKRTTIPVYGISPGNSPQETDRGINEDSLFHAKVIYLEGVSSRVLGTGSANLTLSGWGRNQEVFHFVPVQSLALYQSIKTFFQSVFTNVGIECPLERRSAFSSQSDLVRFCHSYQGDVFVRQLFAGKSLEHLAVWSPYFSKDLAGFISQLKQNFNQPQMKISLVADRVDGHYLRTEWSETLAQMFAGQELCLHQNPKQDERVAMTHAKLWKTSSHLAIGSWNFTHSGANTCVGSPTNGRHNNIEAGFIIADDSPIDRVLGKALDAHDGLFATDKQLEDDPFIVPEALPFDITVTFDWASQTYRFTGQWHASRPPEQTYLLMLPDHDKKIRLVWQPLKKLLQVSELRIPTVRSLLTDHCFKIFNGEKVCHIGMLIEMQPQYRRAQEYDDLKSLFDAMAYSGNEPSLDDTSYRVRETESGELLLDGKLIEGDEYANSQTEGSAEEISYFRLFAASYQYAARLHAISDIRTLEHWVFSRPGCLEELVGKTFERIAQDGKSVFSWFLAQEVNGLCDLARHIRKRYLKSEQSIPESRWRALSIVEPELPDEANDDYRQSLLIAYQQINSKWGMQ
jgi:hypothetical protein